MSLEVRSGVSIGLLAVAAAISAPYVFGEAVDKNGAAGFSILALVAAAIGVQVLPRSKQ